MIGTTVPCGNNFISRESVMLLLTCETKDLCIHRPLQVNDACICG